MLNRRRFLTISAAAFGLPLLAGSGPAAPRVPELYLWRGTAMGAEASIRLAHPDAGTARRLVDGAVAEIARLERIFSLYRPDSALSRLNRLGTIEAPPLELVELLAFAAYLSGQCGGAFDVTVQPLFRLYLEHFRTAGADPAGPPAAAIEAALRLVDYRLVEISSERVVFRRPEMAVTLNGAAQGYITDRVVALLRAGGCEQTLVDLGEARALGRRPDGRPWRAGIADPRQPERVLAAVDLDGDSGSSALATSGGYGTRFDPAGRHHHLLDPQSGRSARHHASVSVAADSALVADALSTALSILPAAEAPRLLRHYPDATAYLVDDRGAVAKVRSGAASAEGAGPAAARPPS